MINRSIATTTIQNRSTDVTRCTNLAIVGITDTGQASCEFDVGNTCVAKHLFHAEVVNGKGNLSYQWSVDIGTVMGSDTDATFEVWVTNNRNVDITVTLVVTDLIMNTSLTKTFLSQQTVQYLPSVHPKPLDGLQLAPRCYPCTSSLVSRLLSLSNLSSSSSHIVSGNH